MAPQFTLVSGIGPLNTKNALRLHLVRTYEIPYGHASNSNKSKECIFHDEEVYHIAQ